MAHPKDEDVYPVGTVVRLKKTGEFAIITNVGFRKDGKHFQNYYGEIEGRGPGNYALYHDEVDLEALPPKDVSSQLHKNFLHGEPTGEVRGLFEILKASASPPAQPHSPLSSPSDSHS